jgi:hypothetical protein
VVQDLFSRFTWAVPMERSADAAEAFGVLLHRTGRTPDELTTDADPAFTVPAFEKTLENHGVIHVVKQGRNDIATVDRAIGTIKRALAVEKAATGEAGWSAKLQGVVRGLNASENKYLFGSAPEDVGPRNKALTFELERKNADFMTENAELIHRRAAVLERHGAFRHLDQAKTLGRRRVFHATWSRELHNVHKVQGAFVSDEAGREFPTKEVLPVPADSSEAHDVRAPVGGAVMNEKRRAELRPFADRALAWLRSQPEKTGSVTRMSLELGANFRQATRTAGLSQKNPMTGFLATFPELFEMTTSRTGGAATVKAV